MIISSQFSPPIIMIANSMLDTSHIKIEIEEGASQDLAILDVLAGESIDKIALILPEGVEFNESATISESQEGQHLTYDANHHQVTIIFDVEAPNDFKLVLNHLAEGMHQLSAIGYQAGSDVTSEIFIFEIVGNDQDFNEKEDNVVVKQESELEQSQSNENAKLVVDDLESEVEKNETNGENIFVPYVGNLNVDLDISPLRETILSGNDAVYRIVLKLTGSRTEYTDATIVIDLPVGDHIQFNQLTSDLIIAGVEPIFDSDTNQLIYQFDSIAAGQTYENIIRLSTENGYIVDGTALDVTASFVANEQVELTDSATIMVEATNPISLSKSYKRTLGNNLNIPTPNSQTVWEITIDVPKNNLGQHYIDENEHITIVDTLPPGLAYHSTISGPEPEQNGNELIWTFDAPSFEEQEQSTNQLFTEKIEVMLVVGSGTIDETLTNQVVGELVFVGNHSDSVSASDSIVVVDSDTANGDITGTWYVPQHLGPANGEGGVASASNRNPNPIVYDDALLAFSHGIAPLPESQYGDFQQYTTSYYIDRHLIFKELRTPRGFVFRPNANYPSGVPLRDDPVFNIEATVNGVRQLLVENAETSRTYNRSELGIETDDLVTEIHLNFTYAPSGMLNNGLATYYFDVSPGYVGPVTNTWDVYGVNGAGRSFANSYNNDPLAGARSAVIAPKPTDQPPIATVGVELIEHVGGQVMVGENRMRVDLNTQNSSTLAMTGALETVVLLPYGVKLAEQTNEAFIDADGRSTLESTGAIGGDFEVLSDSYNASGRQLVKFTWYDHLLRPGQSVYAEIDLEIDSIAPSSLLFEVYGFSGDNELAVPSVSDPALTDTVLQTDTGDLNDNGNEDQPRIRSGNIYSISGNYNIQTEKLVRGQLDNDFSHFGKTVPGGSIDYRLILSNTTSRDISFLTLIDVLPSIGDLGITDNIDRGSQFTPNLSGPIQLPIEWEELVNVYYSSAKNPYRDDLIQNTIYPDSTEQLSNPSGSENPDWVLEANVADWSEIHSFKIELKDDTEWIAGQDMVIEYTMQAPLWSEVSEDILDPTVDPATRAAWNSFAIATDNGQPVEPLRVGIYMEYDNSVLLSKVDEEGETLEGVVFDLVNEQEEVVLSGLTTNEEGVISVENLQPGRYAFIETDTLPGYQLDPTPIPFTIEFSQQEQIEVVKVNEYATGSVELTKLGEDNDGLQGAVFTLVNEDGDVIETGLTTNEQGILIVEELKPGNYAFIETEAPFGHEIDPTPIEFEIVFNQQDVLQIETINEQARGSVLLIKEGEDGSLLEGVTFELQDQEGQTLQTDLRTDADGELYISDLKPGYYQLVETASIPGYELDTSPIEFEIELGQSQTLELTFVNPLSTGSVQLLKVGEDDESLAGAVFTLVDNLGEEIEIGLRTDDDGLLMVDNLKPGEYAFIETEAPFGYQLNETPIPFEIVFNQQETIEVEVVNNYIPSSFELTKEGENGTFLEGAVFELQDGAGNTLQTNLMTDENGKLLITGLTPGAYQLIETATLPGYELDSTPIEFEIGLGQTEVTEVTFVNNLTPGSVQLNKVSELGEALEGAIFTLVDDLGEEIETDLRTDAEGILLIENLLPGQYSLIETEAPFGYELDSRPITFEIDFDQQTVIELEFENEQSTGAVQLIKEDEDGKRLEGVAFELQDSDGNILQEDLITNSDGRLLIEDLKPGNYQLVETATIPGYDLDTSPIEFEIELGQLETVEVHFINPLTPGAFQLLKVGEGGETLAGAMFTLFDSDGNEMLTNLETDEQGLLVVEDLKPGQYTLVETQAPFGFQLDDTPIEFEIAFNQQEILELVMENLYTPSAFELVKEGEDGVLLEGVVFELQDGEGNTLQTDLVTNENGRLLISNLNPGIYKLIEIETIPGYDLDQTPIEFEIGLGESQVSEFTFVNTLTPGSVELIKIDEKGATLEGAVFTLVNEDGDEIDTGLTTNEQGILLVEELKPGNYAFIETEAPFGYQLDDTPLNFEIEKNQQETLTLDFENTILLSEIEIIKVDSETDNTLAGAEFELVNESGEIIANVVTDNSGRAVIEDLPPGEYQLIEKRAPYGYSALTEPVEILIELGQSHLELVIENNPVEHDIQPPVSEENENPFQLPQTGEEWLRYLMILGGMLVGTGSLIVINHFKKVRRKLG